MSARLNRLWRLAARPQGAFKASDFQWVEEPARAPAEGEVLVRSVYLSLDPTQRNWANEQASYLPPVGLGEVMRGGVIGVVEESRDPALKPGDRVQGVLGWQSYATVPARAVTALPAVKRNISWPSPLSIAIMCPVPPAVDASARSRSDRPRSEVGPSVTMAAPVSVRHGG
jgi:hypothetical protein